MIREAFILMHLKLVVVGFTGTSPAAHYRTLEYIIDYILVDGNMY